MANRIKVITVTSDLENQGFHCLIASLQKFGWDYDVLKVEWRGFGTKIIEVYYHLKNHPEIEQFVFCDANDVVVLGTEEEFAKKVRGLDGPLFSTERGCWPDEKLRDNYPTQYDHGFNFLNSGLYYYQADQFIEMVEVGQPTYVMDDQRWFTRLYLLERNIILDNNCEVLQCYSFIQEDDFGYDNNRLKNLKTGTQPIFVHGNGRTDLTKVYELLK